MFFDSDITIVIPAPQVIALAELFIEIVDEILLMRFRHIGVSGLADTIQKIVLVILSEHTETWMIDHLVAVPEFGYRAINNFRIFRAQLQYSVIKTLTD